MLAFLLVSLFLFEWASGLLYLYFFSLFSYFTLFLPFFINYVRWGFTSSFFVSYFLWNFYEPVLWTYYADFYGCLWLTLFQKFCLCLFAAASSSSYSFYSFYSLCFGLFAFDSWIVAYLTIGTFGESCWLSI